MNKEQQRELAEKRLERLEKKAAERNGYLNTTDEYELRLIEMLLADLNDDEESDED
jgi:hypothetical protein